MKPKAMQHKAQVWIVHDRQVLLFKVIPKRGGGWHPVTGSVEPEEAAHEDWLAAAQRETLEETGISPQAGTWKDLEYQFDFVGRFGPATEHVFLFCLEGHRPDVTLDPKEHLECQWVDILSASAWLGFDSQRHALEMISCYLQDRS